MSDPRRRRQIKTPSGPKKKEDTTDLSKYKFKAATGRQEVPKPQPKPDPSQQRRQGGRGGQGGRGQGRQGGQQRRQGGRVRVAAAPVDEARVVETNRAPNPRP